MGPNMKKLICEKMARDAIPPGSGVAAGVAFLSDPKKIVAGAQSASNWVKFAIKLVKEAPDSKYTDDEEIAGIILKKIEEKRAKTRKQFSRLGWDQAIEKLEKEI